MAETSTNEDLNLKSQILKREESTPTRNNPLSELSSSTYNITLYMVDATVMNKFIAGGGTMAGISPSDPGLTIISQSGGSSNEESVITDRNGNALDYYIDDLDITTYFPGGDKKATASTQIKFKIIEPYGFSFLHDLTRAGLKLNERKDKLAENMVGVKQHYIIGIKFKGYDVDGNIIEDTRIDSRYFAIRITKLKFKLDGKAVNYNVEAVVMSESVANGQINGTVKTATTLSGKTVYSALADPKNSKSLVSVLNAVGETNKDNKQVVTPTKYSIEFLDNGEISKQELINEKSYDEKLGATFGAKTSEKSTIAAQLNATQYDNATGEIQVTPGSHILSIIDSIIVKSDYVSSALSMIMDASVESKASGQLSESKPLKWYSVNPVVKIAGTDPKTNDWAYEITFQISTYTIPYIRLATANVTSPYQGPFKRYEYWLTGKNSEILSYEQQYDNLYYMSQIMARNASDEQRPNGERPTHPENAVSADKTGIEGKNFVYNADAAAQLYSPGDSARAKLRIIGDPDYITSLIGVNSDKSKERDFQLSPLNGQKFIEIKFCMAEDYGSDGLLDVSGNIQFYGTATIKEKLKIDGAVYRIIKVDSVFSRGLFSQTLDLVLVDQTVLTIKNDAGESSTDNKNYSSEGRTAPLPGQNYGNEGRAYQKIGATTGNPSGARIPASMRNKSTTAEMVPAAVGVVTNTGTTNKTSLVTAPDANLPRINPKTLLPIAGREN